MNQLQPYEELIADKFSNAPIPSMMDEIWAIVEMQLPGELSVSTEGLEKPSVQPATGSGLTTLIKILVIAALTIALILLIKKTNNKTNSKNRENLPVAPPAEKKIIPDSTILEDTFSENPVKRSKKEAKFLNDIPGAADSISLPERPSSVIKLPTDANDSGKLNLPAGIITPKNNPVILNPSIQKSTTEKKGKGAKGIKDGDYKIIPTKNDTL